MKKFLWGAFFFLFLFFPIRWEEGWYQVSIKKIGELKEEKLSSYQKILWYYIDSKRKKVYGITPSGEGYYGFSFPERFLFSPDEGGFFIGYGKKVEGISLYDEEGNFLRKFPYFWYVIPSKG